MNSNALPKNIANDDDDEMNMMSLTVNVVLQELATSEMCKHQANLKFFHDHNSYVLQANVMNTCQAEKVSQSFRSSRRSTFQFLDEDEDENDDKEAEEERTRDRER